MGQQHLTYRDRVNLGSYYTPSKIVEYAWDILKSHASENSIIIDTACGYGDFLLNLNQENVIGCDLDETAIKIAKENNYKVRFFHTNSLHKLSREKFGISEGSKLVVVGNPPYNDRTSLIRNGIKDVCCDIDEDLKSRDLGISFLRSYDKLKADVVCVLHPLSYLIKPANFKMLKQFAMNYKLIDSLVISSNEFKESKKFTPFPIVIALYVRDGKGMDYDFIRSFRFKTIDKTEFCIKDFDYISNYINKYPSKKGYSSNGNGNSLFFWTMRDINALKRNKTFVKKPSDNTITIDRSKLEYYIYVDVFKRNIDRFPFYFGNCDILINDDLFQNYQHYFIQSSLDHHPFLAKHIKPKGIDKKRVETKLNIYFSSLLKNHNAIYNNL